MTISPACGSVKCPRASPQEAAEAFAATLRGAVVVEYEEAEGPSR